ncbi:MAG: MFS transporter [Gammaproteobacteria bacterium]|nr:MFS transporter [Gammaproteobacteria bacterium]MDE2250918.1 MFS transporter [Gammaproteobacteria bacterium]
MWGITRYQWLVLFAAWLGWGFDVFDGLLFNYVAPNCIPTLLHLPLGSAAARSATLFWTGTLTSLLLVGWALGGILFGFICDRFGRMRTLLFTMVLYALGTAACAAATNLTMLAVFRLVASLGIGGEWAAGASMVAEVMPEKRRVEGGALLYTAAPFGLFLATGLNYLVAGVWFANDAAQSWRYVFLCGLLPAVVAFTVRWFIHEPERWQSVKERSQARLRQIFTPELRRRTLLGTMTTIIALAGWWSCNAFIPVIATGLARGEAALRGFDQAATLGLVEQWKFTATLCFNLGGLIGTLLTIPLAKRLGRRPMFAWYFGASAAAIFATFGLDMPPAARLYMFFLIGAPVFGVFGAFPFYLTELFPTRLRATGAGFCYNIGRVLAAVGPFIVGAAAARGTAMQTIFYVGFAPLLGLLLVPLIIETRGGALAD